MWFRKYLKRFDMAGFGFHRFRHTFVDALRSAGYMDEEITAIIGHKPGGTQTSRYGSLSAGTLKARVEMLAAVSFPTVDLSSPHLSTSL